MSWTAADARQKNTTIKSDTEAQMWVNVANKTLKAELAKGVPGKEAEAHAPDEKTWKADLVRCAAFYAALPLVYLGQKKAN